MDVLLWTLTVSSRGSINLSNFLLESYWNVHSINYGSDVVVGPYECALTTKQKEIFMFVYPILLAR